MPWSHRSQERTQEPGTHQGSRNAPRTQERAHIGLRNAKCEPFAGKSTPNSKPPLDHRRLWLFSDASMGGQEWPRIWASSFPTDSMIAPDLPLGFGPAPARSVHHERDVAANFVHLQVPDARDQKGQKGPEVTGFFGDLTSRTRVRTSCPRGRSWAVSSGVR